MTARFFEKRGCAKFFTNSRVGVCADKWRLPAWKKQTPRHRSDGARRCVMMAKVTDVSSIDDVNNEQAI